MNFIKKNGIGILLCLAIASPSWFLGKIFPVVGGAVIAIIAGMIITMFWNDKKNAEAGKAIFPASAVPGKTILAISSVVRGLPKRIIYFSSSVQSRASRMVVHFSYLSSLLLSEYAWLFVASCTAR